MMNLRLDKVGKHLLFWLGIFLFYAFAATSSDPGTQVITTIFRFPLLIVAAYLFNYWQVPKYLKRKKYIAFSLSMIIVLLVLILVYRVMGYYYLDRFCDSGPYPLISLIDIPFYIFSFHFPALMMYFYKITKEREEEKEKMLELQKDKISTELKYLKAQLNPHFLFNTLNNLYSFVVINSPKAPDIVLQLSEILDYILYKSQKASVPLHEEIHTINNYLALEDIKYGDRLEVMFNIDVTDKNQNISPLILLSIVENAFKHGVRDNIVKPKILIELKQDGGNLIFTVWNKKPQNQISENTDSYESGIGLANIKRQLDLLYTDKHKFDTEDTQTSFYLKLTLDTND